MRNELTWQQKSDLKKIVTDNLKILGEQFNRPPESIPRLVDAWMKTIEATRLTARWITEGFQRSAEETDKFPSPANIIRAAKDCYKDKFKTNFEDDFHRRYRFLGIRRYDQNGTECRIDDAGSVHYAAKDCAEGRAFLKRLKEIGQKITTPEATDESEKIEITDDDVPF